MLVQDGEDLCEETVSTSTAVGMYVHDDYGMLDCYCRWSLRSPELVEVGGRSSAAEFRTHLVMDFFWVWNDNSSLAFGIHNILDPDGNTFPYHLGHGAVRMISTSIFKS